MMPLRRLRRLIARLLWPALDSPTIRIDGHDGCEWVVLTIEYPRFSLAGLPGARLSAEECEGLAVALRHAAARLVRGLEDAEDREESD